jgi:two-component system, chemotaxis family, chemotaxis protein CheV
VTNSEQILVLSFQVDTPTGAVPCGLNVHKVREVVECSGLNFLPKEYAPFMGIFDLRGMPVPVMPLTSVFAGSEPETSGRGRILIIELQDKAIGLHVASTGRIQSYPSVEVREPPAALEGMKSRFFNGMLRTGSGYVYLLDVESILDSFGLSLDGESRTEGLKPEFAGKRVLVAEDSRLYQKKIRQIFEAWGCVLEVAANGQEALDLAEKHSYKFDLVFTDIEMPVMNGIEFATKLKMIPKAATIPIVFNSSLSNPMLIEEIKEQGLGGYIVKFNQDAIHAEVAKSLKGAA